MKRRPHPLAKHERNEALLNAFAAGALYKVLEMDFGITRGSVARIIDRARKKGDPRAALRQRGAVPDEASRAEIRAMLDRGLSLYAIAKLRKRSWRATREMARRMEARP